MMKRLITVLLFFVLICTLVSCELFVPEKKQGAMHIVVYGNDYKTDVRTTLKHRGSTITVPTLDGTVNDAVQMGNLMAALCEKTGRPYDVTYLIGEEMTYRKTKPIYGVPEVGENVRVITDLSRNSLRSIFYEAARDESISENDVYLFFYSGHGFYDYDQYTTVDYSEDVSELGYFCPSSNKRANPAAELYRFSEFLEDIAQIKGKKVVIADCCYSGCLVVSDGFSVDESLYPNANIHGMGKSRMEKDLYVLASSQYYLESQDERNHGEFMNCFLAALGWNEEEQKVEDIPAMDHGLLTMDGIASYVRFYNNEDYKSDRKQKVSVTGGSQDFILFDFR